VRIGDSPQSDEVGVVVVVGTGRRGGDLVEAVRVCGRGEEGIPRPGMKSYYQGRTVVGHMRSSTEPEVPVCQ
jgi:hypothetical protein